MKTTLLAALLALAACGADGPPEPPTRAGLQITGQTHIGVASK